MLSLVPESSPLPILHPWLRFGLATGHDFYDLCAIAKKNWEPLPRALGKRGEMLPLLERFDRLGNTVAHSRPLLGFEQDLL